MNTVIISFRALVKSPEKREGWISPPPLLCSPPATAGRRLLSCASQANHLMAVLLLLSAGTLLQVSIASRVCVLATIPTTD